MGIRGNGSGGVGLGRKKNKRVVQDASERIVEAFSACFAGGASGLMVQAVPGHLRVPRGTAPCLSVVQRDDSFVVCAGIPWDVGDDRRGGRLVRGRAAG